MPGCAAIPYKHLRHASNYEDSGMMPAVAVLIMVLIVSIVVYCICKKRRASSCRACASARRSQSGDKGGDHDDDTPVDAESDEHLDEIVSSGKKTIVIFWAPWCPHCKTFLPEFEKACAKHKDCVFVKASDEHVSEAPKKYNIEGYPTVKKFDGGKEVATFEGPRTMDALIVFANE